MKIKIKVLLTIQTFALLIFIIGAGISKNSTQRFGAFILFASITLVVMWFLLRRISILFSTSGLNKFFVKTIFVIGFLIINFAGSGSMINFLKENKFQKQFPEYREFINLIHNVSYDLPCEMANITIPKKYKHLGQIAIMAEQNTNGIAIIFVTETGFMGKFPGYLYVSSGNIKEGSPLDKILYNKSRIDANWFEVILFKLETPLKNKV